MKKIQAIVLLVPLIVILLIANSAMLQSVSRVYAAQPVGTNIDVTSDSVHSSESQQYEPNIAVDPLNPNRLVVGYDDNQWTSAGWAPKWGLSWSYSSDGGSTWTFGGTFTNSANHFVYSGMTYNSMVNPIVAFDNQGTVYYCGLVYNRTINPIGSFNGSIFLAKSYDWPPKFYVFQKVIEMSYGDGSNPYLDRPWMCIDPVTNYIYIAWGQRMNAFATPQNGETCQIMFTRSTDGGINFSPPIQLSQGATSPYPFCNGAQIAVGANGNVYVAYTSWNLGILSKGVWSGTPGPSQKPNIWICQSTDYGDTFNIFALVTPIYHAMPDKFISMGVDRTGAYDRIYIAYVDRQTDAGDTDIYVANHTGNSIIVSWDTKTVNDNPNDGTNQFWPSLSVSGNGRVEVLWNDWRDGINNVYYSSSEDKGGTWDKNTKLTDVSPNIDTSNAIDFTGSIASLNDKALCVWIDNRLGNPEIFFATVSAPAPMHIRVWQLRFPINIYHPWGVPLPTYLQLPDGYNASEINASSLILNSTISSESATIGYYNNDTAPELLVAFNMSSVSSFILDAGITLGNVSLTITGQLNDGTLIEGTMTVGVSALMGDVNCDGKVDLADLVSLAYAYKSCPGDSNWNPNADFALPYGVIGLSDLVTIGAYYGQHY